jgi:cytochrome c-type biogenesis protein CcmF
VSLVGRAALLLALAAALYAIYAALRARRDGASWQRSAEGAVYAVFGLTSAAIATLWLALLTDRFEFRNVAEYTSSTLDWWFKLSALWGSQAGSLLLWAWILTGFAAAVVFLNRDRNRELMPVVVAVLMGIAVFFAFLLSFVSSPFETLATVPEEGRGLNPLLQNPYMVSHPPLLYFGYVGLAVPFAFAMAALVERRLDTAWFTAVRGWTITAWGFLGIGILLGARWAYEELGWGGYWAWDPVENAAFMPWLVATAFLHSVMVQERRGMLRVWNMVLVVLTFSLALFGTFLTRSGIIASVHAFGESTLGAWFLVFIAVVLGGAVALIIARLPLLRSKHSLESFVSREAVFLYNNLLLLALAFAVFWGTIFPVISEAARDSRITVGQGYYDQIAVPIGVALLILTGIGPLIPWRKASLDALRRRFLVPVAVGVVAGVLLAVFTPAWENWVAGLVFSAAAFVGACVIGEYWRGTKVRHAAGGVSWPGAFFGLFARNRRRYGGYMVHLGVVVLFIGLAGSTAFTTSGDLALSQGERGEVAGYTFVYDSALRERDEHKGTVGVTLGVFEGDSRVATLSPRTNFYFADEQRSTEIAIDSDLRRDIYIVLVGLSEGGLARVSVFVNPLVMWIWLSGLMIALGTAIAAWPRRRSREPVVPERTAGEAERV